MEGRTQFDYLLNAFERASQSQRPADLDYAGKRRALFEYVRRLEQAARDLAVWQHTHSAPSDEPPPTLTTYPTR